MSYNPFMSKIDAMGIAHQQHIDRMAARDDAIERRQIELYEDMDSGKGDGPKHFADMICEVVDDDMADLIHTLVWANKDADDTARKLYQMLETNMSDYAERVATYEVDHPPKEEL